MAQRSEIISEGFFYHLPSLVKIPSARKYHCHFASLTSSAKEVSVAVFSYWRNFFPAHFGDKGRTSTAGCGLLGAIRLWPKSERGEDGLSV